MAQSIEIVTPDLGNVSDVSVIEVHVKPGDTISKDSSVVTLESDKATMDLPAGHAGKVDSVKVKVGDKVSAGSVLLTVAAGDQGSASSSEKPKQASEQEAKRVTSEAIAAASAQSSITKEKEKSEKEKSEKETPAASKQETKAPASTQSGDAPQPGEDVHAGPSVRRFARELGVILSRLIGSGPKGRILKEDVQQYVKSQMTVSPEAVTAPMAGLPPMPVIDFSQFGAIKSEPLSRIKKLSGKNLQRNWSVIPHVTQFGEADITELEAFRQAELHKKTQASSVKLTPLVFIMKAVAVALKAFPTFNASLDATLEELILKQYFHIGVAVDTPDGLVVPVIRDVDQKGLQTLAHELAEVSDRARKKQMLPKDMQGGCFSISSLGGIGGTAFTPIINAPEVAILGVSRSSYKPVYQDGVFVPRLMLPLSLSYDHRVIDGAEGARFMVYLTTLLSDIRQCLL